MNGRFWKYVAPVLLALVVCVVLLSLAHGSNEPKRGDYPQCQDECLRKLERRMTELREEYKRTERRLDYEEKVEKARGDYDDCIATCKDVLPVK